MTEKEVRKLRRVELLEILVEQSKEVEALRDKLEDAEQKLKDRRILLEKGGSIAEAALQLNGVFDAAQSAAQQYLENIRYLNDNQEKICAEKMNRTKEQCEAMEREAKAKCEAMEREAKARFEAMERAAHEAYEKMLKEAQEVQDGKAAGNNRISGEHED